MARYSGAVARAFRTLHRLAKGFVGDMSTVHREQVLELTRHEVRELENVFVLLLMGSFTGLPAPPSFLAVELLPYLEHELAVADRRATGASDVLAELAGCLDIN